MFWKSSLYMSTSSLFLIPRIHTEFLVIIFDRAENRSSTLVWETRGDCCLKSLKEKQIILYSQHLPKKLLYSFLTIAMAPWIGKNTWNIVKITFSCGNYHIITGFFCCCLPPSRTKDHRTRSPFLELQAIYLSLELAASLLSRETWKLSSGIISARYVLIQVRYSW